LCCCILGNCYCHVLHNAVKTAHDDLPIDIETVLCKTYSYFARSAKRVEHLKKYFEFVEVDFSVSCLIKTAEMKRIVYKTLIFFFVKVLLKHITIRWLSLLRSIERLLQNFDPVKLFFLNEQKSTKTLQFLKSFFSNEEGFCILNFLQNVLFEIQKAELQLQSSNTTAVDLHFIITNLINKLRQKVSDKYYGNNTRLVLNRLKEIDEIKSEELMNEFDLFINTVIEYIESYFDDNRDFYEKLSFFNAQSIDFLTWQNVIAVADVIGINDLDKDQLYSEFCDIKCLCDSLRKKNIKLNDQINFYISSKTNDFCSSTIINQCVACDNSDSGKMISLSNVQNEPVIKSDQLWAYLLNTNPTPTPNFKKMISFVFSIPCSNSYVESIFSHMKHLWSDYRNQMDVELISAELKIRMNVSYSCEQFYKHILSEKQLLKQIRKNSKYE
jgi:hypothetical protein